MKTSHLNSIVAAAEFRSRIDQVYTRPAVFPLLGCMRMSDIYPRYPDIPDGRSNYSLPEPGELTILLLSFSSEVSGTIDAFI